MTRLKSADIAHLTLELKDYDKQLKEKTGMTLGELGCRAATISQDTSGWTCNLRVAAVPVTSGDGVISNFTETLVAIATHLGFAASVTKQSDIAGIAEAYQKGFDVILAADDRMFCAINTKNGHLVDNAEATAKGFSHGLAGLAGGLKHKPVLVLGCGPVGRAGIETLVTLGARVTVYDPIKTRCYATAMALPEADVEVAANLEDALKVHSLIFEATPVANSIPFSVVNENTYIAAPGVPCGVSEDTVKRLGSRLLWDPLQIGVASMLMEAAFAVTTEEPAAQLAA